MNDDYEAGDVFAYIGVGLLIFFAIGILLNVSSNMFKLKTTITLVDDYGHTLSISEFYDNVTSDKHFEELVNAEELDYVDYNSIELVSEEKVSPIVMAVDGAGNQYTYKVKYNDKYEYIENYEYVSEEVVTTGIKLVNELVDITIKGNVQSFLSAGKTRLDTQIVAHESVPFVAWKTFNVNGEYTGEIVVLSTYEEQETLKKGDQALHKVNVVKNKETGRLIEIE